MHIVNKNLKLKQDVKEVRTVPCKKKYLGTIRPKKGHFIFCYKNGEIRKVNEGDFEIELVLHENGKTSKKKSLKVEKGVMYVSALNEKNALKKLYKFICE